MTQPPAPIELSYESATAEPVGRRPKWVWAIVIIYLAILSLVMLLPLWVKLGSPDDNGPLIAATIAACVVALCGLGLVFTRVRVSRRRPITRRSLWIPLITSGFLAGALFVGAGYALAECLKIEDLVVPVSIGGGAVWVMWSVLIWYVTANRDPNSVASWLNRALFAGSVVELFVAVPCHVIVRRRGECCGGILTGTGICVGCIVMLLSLGPGVAFLYYKRWKQISGK